MSAGAFTLSATSSTSTIATASLSTQLTIANYVYTVLTAVDTSTPSKNFAFSVTVTLKGEDGNLYMTSSTVVLTETSSATISGTASKSSTNGEAQFSIYFSQAGSKTIRATCDSIYADVSVEVLDQVLVMTIDTEVIKM